MKAHSGIDQSQTQTAPDSHMDLNEEIGKNILHADDIHEKNIRHVVQAKKVMLLVVILGVVSTIIIIIGRKLSLFITRLLLKVVRVTNEIAKENLNIHFSKL